jgi:hypothetical protein
MTKKNQDSTEEKGALTDELVAKAFELADAGTEEAIETLEDMLFECQDEDLSGLIEMSLRDCEYEYYRPKNETDERDLSLAIVVSQQKDYFEKIEADLEKAEQDLASCALDIEIHQLVLKAAGQKKKAWADYASAETKVFFEGRVNELRDEAEYLEAWLEEADKLFSSDKYRQMSSHALDLFIAEGSEIDEDEEDCDCDGSCDCEDEHCCC